MKLLQKIRSAIVKRLALAAMLMGGFLVFLGAGTASAHPRVFVGVGVGGPVVVRGYYAPPYYYGPAYGPVYVGPRYYGPRYGYYYGPRYRFWDERYHCWRYR